MDYGKDDCRTTIEFRGTLLARRLVIIAEGCDGRTAAQNLIDAITDLDSFGIEHQKATKEAEGDE